MKTTSLSLVRLVIHKISNLVYGCSGFWDPDHNWYDGHIWSECLYLLDALGLSDLKITEMDC